MEGTRGSGQAGGMALGLRAPNFGSFVGKLELKEKQQTYNKPHTKIQCMALMYFQLLLRHDLVTPSCPLQSTFHFLNNHQGALSENTALTMSVPRVKPIFVIRWKQPSMAQPLSPRVPPTHHCVFPKHTKHFSASEL